MPEDTDSSVKRSLTSVYWKRALIYYSLEDWKKVQADLEKSETIAKSLIAQDPEDKSMARMLQTIYAQMAPVLGELKQFDRAIALGEKNHSERQAAYDADNKNTGRFRELTGSFFSQATIYQLAGQTEKACKNYRQSLRNWEIIEKNGNATELDKALSLIHI